MNLFISRVLRTGVVLSAAVVLLGLVLFLVTGRTGYEAALGAAGGPGGPNVAELVRFGVKGAFPTSLAATLAGAAALKPFAIIQLGLLLLIATPIIRVATSVAVFAVERDRLYVAITLFVLLVLCVSLAAGRG